jgi:hypothetical protein
MTFERGAYFLFYDRPRFYHFSPSIRDHFPSVPHVRPDALC